MEKDFDKTEKKTTEDDDDKLNTKNSSRKTSKNENDESTKKKPDKPASFFADSSDGDASEEKSKNNKSDNNEEESTNNEDLTEDEVQEVVQIIIDDREQHIANELVVSEDGSPEELEAVAVGLFLESLRHEALSENEISPESIELAYTESLEDLEISTDIYDSGVDKSNSPTTLTVSTSSNTENISPPTPINTAQQTSLVLHKIPSSTSIDSIVTPTVSPMNSSPNVVIGQPNQHNKKQNIQNRNFIPVPIPLSLDSGSALLAGTITGYIIGRRSKKSSVNLNTSTHANKKLESQVQQLQVAIYEKESILRSDARKSSENSIDITYKPLIIAERRIKRIELREELKRRQELVNNPKVEKIGNFSLPALKIYRERRLPDGTENTPKRKPVEIMTVRELLDKSGHVKYEKWTIEELYKAHRITEKILRQVTKEYMRDGPYKQTLSREVLPDPKIVAEKYNIVDDIHQYLESKKLGISSRTDSDKTLNSNNQINSSPAKNKVEKKNSPKENSLPLPWITAVTAIGTLIALALIYIL